jgi:hypothetical protein
MIFVLNSGADNVGREVILFAGDDAVQFLRVFKKNSLQLFFLMNEPSF